MNNCGGYYPHKFGCPAKGKECYYCHKRVNFLSVCRKKLKNEQRSQQLSQSQHLREISGNAEE